MAALVLIDGEILLRVRETWMIMTKVDENTCPDRWYCSTKSEEDLHGFNRMDDNTHPDRR